MKIFDCFRYCGEDLLLKIRLKTLFNQVDKFVIVEGDKYYNGCLLYTSPSPRDRNVSRMPSSA